LTPVADVGNPSKGADTILGGPGDDVLWGGTGADALTGGEGSDVAFYLERSRPVSVTLDGRPGDGEAGENDAIAADVEGAVTGSGADTVVGNDAGGRFFLSDGPDTLDAGGGDDMIEGGLGPDRLDAGAGNDWVMAAEDPEQSDPVADEVTCGDGTDEAVLDRLDAAGADCERRIGFAGAVLPPPAAAKRVPVAAGLELRRVRVRGRKAARTIRLSGRLLLPAGTDPGACAGAIAEIKLRRGRRIAARRAVRFDGSCSFKATLPRRASWGRRLTADVAFAGSLSLLPASRSLAIR
jgi:hypothetical protein